MRILITGSEGTLGRKLRAELESRGHVVWGCDLKHNENPRHTRADICDIRQLERALHDSNPDVVYHLAAEFGRNNGEEYYEQLWRSNAIGTRNLIEWCTRLGLHLIFASSSEAYGDVADQGDLYEDILLTHVPKFHNEYALSKYTNEKQIEIAVRNRGLQATILRFFNAYGPGEEYNPYRSVVCLFIYRLLKGLPITVYKDYHRVFMYVDDWARTVANVAERVSNKQIDNGQAYNIGGEEYCSIEELVAKILPLIGGSKSTITLLPKEKANITNKRPNNSKARIYLGHNPVTTLDQGLPPTIEWMLNRYKLELPQKPYVGKQFLVPDETVEGFYPQIL